MEIKQLNYEELTPEEQKYASNNGSGREYATYVKITDKGETLFLESDAIEPEDVKFYRDLSWVIPALNQCYLLGKRDGILEAAGQNIVEQMESGNSC